MPLVLDGLMVLTLIYFIGVSYANGVVKSVLNFASLAVSYIAALALSPMAAGLIEKTHIVDVFSKNMSEALNSGDSVLPGLGGAGERFVEEFTALTGTEKALDMSLDMVDLIYSRQVTGVLGFIIVFFLATIAVRIAINMLNIVAMLPGLGAVNRFFGLIFGLLEGIVMCYAVCIIIMLIMPFFGNGFGIAGTVPQTSIFKLFYENNLLTAFIPFKPL